MVCAGKGKVDKSKERDRAYTYDLAHSSAYRTLSASSLKDKTKWLETWAKAKRQHEERKKERSKIVYEAAKRKGLGDLGNGETARLDLASNSWAAFSPPPKRTPASPSVPSVPYPGSPVPSLAARRPPPSPSNLAAPHPGSTVLATTVTAVRSRSGSIPAPSTAPPEFITTSTSAPTAPTALSISPRETLSKLREAISKAKDRHAKRDPACKTSSEADSKSSRDNDTQGEPTQLIAELRTKNAAKPPPVPRRVMSSDCEPSSPRPPVPPLPSLLRNLSGPGGRNPNIIRREQPTASSPPSRQPPPPPLPPMPQDLCAVIAKEEQIAAMVSDEDDRHEEEDEEAEEEDAGTPKRPPRPTRLQEAGKQRSFCRARDVKADVADQLAKWNQFYDSATHSVRSTTVQAPNKPLPSPRQASTPTPTSCPAAIHSSSASSPVSSSTSSAPSEEAPSESAAASDHGPVQSTAALRRGTFGPIDPTMIPALGASPSSS